MSCPSTPFAPHSGQAFGRPAGLLTKVTLGVRGQVSLSPVMVMRDSGAWFRIRDPSGAFLAVCNREILTFEMDTVFTNFTSDGRGICFDSPSANVTEFPLQMTWFGPTVRNGILDDIGCHGRTGRHDCLETSVMNNKIADFTDASLLNQSPEHVRTVVTVGRLMEGLFRKEMAVSMLIVFRQGHGFRRGNLRDGTPRQQLLWLRLFLVRRQDWPGRLKESKPDLKWPVGYSRLILFCLQVVGREKVIVIRIQIEIGRSVIVWWWWKSCYVMMTMMITSRRIEMVMIRPNA